jgi:hypothetical protein
MQRLLDSEPAREIDSLRKHYAWSSDMSSLTSQCQPRAAAGDAASLTGTP